jgi:hypothetical protein
VRTLTIEINHLTEEKKILDERLLIQQHLIVIPNAIAWFTF